MKLLVRAHSSTVVKLTRTLDALRVAEDELMEVVFATRLCFDFQAPIYFGLYL